MIDDAVQHRYPRPSRCSLDVITDGEATRIDFNLFLLRFPEKGSKSQFIDESEVWFRMLNDQRGKHSIIRSTYSF